MHNGEARRTFLAALAASAFASLWVACHFLRRLLEDVLPRVGPSYNKRQSMSTHNTSLSSFHSTGHSKEYMFHIWTCETGRLSRAAKLLQSGEKAY